MWWRALLLAVVMAVPAISVQAQKPVPGISTDRPGQTTPPAIVPSGYVQMELGGGMAQDEVADVTTKTLSTPSVLVRIGLLERMELRVGTDYRSVNSSSAGSDTTISGLAGVTLGTKIGITGEDGAIPEASFVMTLALPEVGSEAFRPVNLAPNLAISTRTTLSGSWSLYANLGEAWDGLNSAGTGFYSLLVGGTLTGDLGGFAELYGSFASSVDPTHAVDAGLSYVAASNLQFDIYGGVGLNRKATDFFVNLGVSLRLPH